MEKEIKQFLSKRLSDKRQFTTGELKTLLRQFNPQISKSTHAWWINKLKKEGFLTQLGRGLYTAHSKEEYKPELSRKAKQFYNKARNYLPEGTPFLIYESVIVAKMYGIEPKRHYIFIHVPREQLDFFFYDILNLGKRVFIKPNSEITKRYIIPFKEAVILYPFLTEMPTMELNGYTTLSTEGILVHSLLFGNEYFRNRDVEVKQVFKVILDRYNVNFSKLLRYAARRKRRKEVLEILNQIEIKL
jgi:hypothetical protein